MAGAARALASCRQCAHCLAGNDNLCRGYQVFGYGRDGGNCELLTAPEYAAIRIPDEMSFETAAAAPLVFLTAWHMLMTQARLQPGEDVLVLAASSGVGMAAIQIARLFRCRVFATAGGEEKLARARALGADHAIDHYRQDIAAEVRRLTGKRGVDVVVEHVGSATWQKSLHSLAPGGRLAICGATTGFDRPVDLRFLFSKQWSLLGSFMGTLGANFTASSAWYFAANCSLSSTACTRSEKCARPIAGWKTARNSASWCSFCERLRFT